MNPKPNTEAAALYSSVVAEAAAIETAFDAAQKQLGALLEKQEKQRADLPTSSSRMQRTESMG